MNFLTEQEREQTHARIFADIGTMTIACDRCSFRRVVAHMSPVAARLGHARRIALAHVCPTECHPDCGPVVARSDGMHAHESDDGRCWHDDNDS